MTTCWGSLGWRQCVDDDVEVTSRAAHMHHK